MFKFIYPVPEILPDNRARFIQIINTCHALANKGVKVEILTGYRKGYDENKILEFYGLSSTENLKIIQLPILRREKEKYFRISCNEVFYFSLLLHLFIHKRNNSIIFCRHLKLAKFLLKFRKFLNLPMIFEVHEIFHKNEKLKESKKLKIKNDEIKVYNAVDILICITEHLKNAIEEFLLKKNKIITIPDAVRAEWFTKERNLEPSFILYTGSLYEWKGVDTLVSSMKFLPNEKLLIIGDGKRLKEIKDLAIKEKVANRVIFVGSVSHKEIPKYLSQAKVAVIPNILKGPSLFSSPLKLFEYMASGIPIVASDLKVFREILQPNETAIFFEPGNPKSLAEAIKKILNSKELSNKLGTNAKKIAKQYTYEKRAEKILNICKDLLKNDT